MEIYINRTLANINNLNIEVSSSASKPYHTKSQGRVAFGVLLIAQFKIVASFVLVQPRQRIVLWPNVCFWGRGQNNISSACNLSICGLVSNVFEPCYLVLVCKHALSWSVQFSISIWLCRGQFLFMKRYQKRIALGVFNERYIHN